MPLLDRPVPPKGGGTTVRGVSAAKKKVNRKSRQLGAGALGGHSVSSDAQPGAAGEGLESPVPENWHWIPKQAMNAMKKSMEVFMPTVPSAPLMQLLLDLNQVERQRCGTKAQVFTHYNISSSEQL